MPIFELIKLEDELPPYPVVAFFKLRIDGKCPYDAFCKELQNSGNQRYALEKIPSILVSLSEGKRVPVAWFKELKHRGKDDPYPDYEIRAKQVRVYLFEDTEKGRIIVLGEVKTEKTQQRTIDRMRAIKRDYFASKK